MFHLSAFADEISPDPQQQIDVLKQCGVRHIEFRSILQDQRPRPDRPASRASSSRCSTSNGFKLSAIGSPIGKIKIDEPFEPHLKRFKRAIELCKVFGTPNIRVFSYYLPERRRLGRNWRNEVMRRMSEKTRLAEKAGVRLLHENEHRIYGDSRARRATCCDAVEQTAAALRGASTTRPTTSSAATTRGGLGARRSEWTAHFHIKDWKAGEKHGRVAGEGQGRIPEVIADAVKTRLRRLRDAGAAPARRRSDRRRHRAGAVPQGGGGVQEVLDRVGAQYQ